MWIKHPCDNCPAKGKECYNCHGLNHFTALCRHHKLRKNSPFRTTSRPTIGNLAKADVVVIPSASTDSPTTEALVLPTHIDHLISLEDIEALLDVKLVISHLVQTPAPEGKLHTDVASDGQTSFHTTLQMVTKQGSKSLPVKVDPGADVNTIPLTKYRKLFPVHFTKAGNLKQKALHPTRHIWTVHDETPHSS